MAFLTNSKTSGVTGNVCAVFGSAQATSIASADIMALPYPEDGSLDLSKNEEILIDDVVRYWRDFVRTGSDSDLMKLKGSTGAAGILRVPRLPKHHFLLSARLGPNARIVLSHHLAPQPRQRHRRRLSPNGTTSAPS